MEKEGREREIGVRIPLAFYFLTRFSFSPLLIGRGILEVLGFLGFLGACGIFFWGGGKEVYGIMSFKLYMMGRFATTLPSLEEMEPFSLLFTLPLQITQLSKI